MAGRTLDPAADADSHRTSPRWLRVADATALKGEGPFTVSANGVDLVVLRTGSGELRAYEGRCPHQGALLGEGEIEEGALVCRNHRWRFDAATGRRTGGGTECLRPCPVREDAGEVFVDAALARELAGDPGPAGGGRATAAAGSARLRTLDDLPGPRPLPLVGNALQIEPERSVHAFEEWARIYGPLFVVRLGTTKALMVARHDLAEPLFRGRPDTYRRPTRLERIFEELRLSGAFTAEGEAWRAQRRLAMEALSLRHLRGFYPTLGTVVKRLLRRVGEAADAGRSIEVTADLMRFTVDVTTLVVFGHDLNTLEKGDDEIIQRHLEHIFPTLARRVGAVVPYWRWFRLPADRRVERAVQELYTWLDSIIGQSRAAIAADPARAETPANFIEAMLGARDAEGRPFSDDVIFGNALTMLVAGEDTTAHTIGWAMHHLCDAPLAAAALREEADAVLGDGVLPPDVDQANRLKYAAAVTNEAMRMRPVAPTAVFEPVRDVVVGDVAVPRGTMIVFVSRAASLDPTNFHAPHDFRPERWVEGATAGKAHDPATLVPFGSGPRICPGRTLALLEMRMVLAALYKTFDFERVGASSEVIERHAWTLSPVGLRMRPRRRAVGVTG